MPVTRGRRRVKREPEADDKEIVEELKSTTKRLRRGKRDQSDSGVTDKAKSSHKGRRKNFSTSSKDAESESHLDDADGKKSADSSPRSVVPKSKDLDNASATGKSSNRGRYKKLVDLDGMIAEMREEVEKRCQEIRKAAEDLCQELSKEFQSHLAQVPKRIRAMGISEFEKSFGDRVSLKLERNSDSLSPASNAGRGSVSSSYRPLRRAQRNKSTSTEKPGELPMDQAQQQAGPQATSQEPKSAINLCAGVNNTKQMPADGSALSPSRANNKVTPSKNATSTSHVLQTPAATPAFHPLLPQTPATAIRAPRRGESIMSVNGSPLGCVGQNATRATIGKGQREGEEMRDDDGLPISVEVTNKDGNVFDLLAPGAAEHLDEDSRADALAQLMSLQEKVSSLMSQLQ